jgi:hypothetical protein
MRTTAIAALLVFTACATTETKPAAEAQPAPKAEPAPAPKAAEPAPQAEPAAAGALTVEFATVEAMKTGGQVVETNYSEKPGDTIISGKTVDGGVFKLNGQVGNGKGSGWAGIGVNWSIYPDAKPIDATKFKSITFRLAATTRLLRLRVAGSDPVTKQNGCYPIVTQEVTEEMKEYTIPFERFAPEGWCRGLGREIGTTLPQVTGNEVVSVNMSGKPITISVGPTTYNP